MNKLIELYRNDLPGRFNEFYMLNNHLSRIINLFDGNLLPPYEVLIHTSSICNLNCKWCIGGYVSRKENATDLLDNNLSSIKNMSKVIKGIVNYKKNGYDYKNKCFKEYKVENVTFSGITGEPLMFKKSILYAIEELSKNDIRVGMFTNGLLITKDMHKTLLKMGYVLISIDAGSSDTYDALKCNSIKSNNFNKVLNNIKELNNSKKISDSNLDINVGYVINQYNYNELYKLASILKPIGVHYLRFKTDIASQLIMNDEQKKIAMEQIDKIKSELCDENFDIVEIHRIDRSNEKARKFNKCFAHYLIGNISSDGNVYLCNYHPKKDGYNYGSAIEKDFGDIWNSMLNNENDKKIPSICPPVCDPYKNRANRLLEEAYDIYKNDGIDELISDIEEIRENNL